jgi:hypothetical protein
MKRRMLPRFTLQIYCWCQQLLTSVHVPRCPSFTFSDTVFGSAFYFKLLCITERPNTILHILGWLKPVMWGLHPHVANLVVSPLSCTCSCACRPIAYT